MNKNVLYWIIGIIIVGGIIWYAVDHSGASMMTADQTATTTATGTTGTTGGTGSSTTGTTGQKTTVGQLLAVTAPQTCTFSDSTNGTSISGTTYAGNGKLRTDLTSIIGAKTTYEHSIVSGGYTYTWVDGSTTGIKVTRLPNSTLLTNDIDLNNIDNFSCTNSVTAQADFTKFNVPTNITFVLQ